MSFSNKLSFFPSKWWTFIRSLCRCQSSIAVDSMNEKCVWKMCLFLSLYYFCSYVSEKVSGNVLRLDSKFELNDPELYHHDIVRRMLLHENRLFTAGYDQKLILFEVSAVSFGNRKVLHRTRMWGAKIIWTLDFMAILKFQVVRI